VHVPTGLDEALQAGQAASWNAPEGHGQQRSLGEWLRERLSGAIASGRQPLTPVFTVGAGAPVDLRLAASPGVGGAQPSDLPQLTSERDVTAQLIQSLRLQFRDGIGEAVLRLKPEHLGSVSIALRVENGGLKANVQAELPAVRQWLESHQDVLRSALAEHGLRLDRFVVDPDGRRDGSSANQSGDEESPHRRRPPQPSAEDQPIFEVVA
jgi:flagellar hook-length control protein FliK